MVVVLQLYQLARAQIAGTETILFQDLILVSELTTCTKLISIHNIINMTNSTRILFAALVLSSGVCLSEAFSSAASSLLAHRHHRNNAKSLRNGDATAPLQYARTSSNLGDGNKPDRREGEGSGRSKAQTATRKKAKAAPGRRRPRSTTVAAASTTSTETVSENNMTKAKASTSRASATKQQREQKNKKKKVEPKNLDGIHMTTEMLNHELLSKQEEQLLGLKVRRSIQMREAADTLMLSKEAETERQRKQHRFEDEEREERKNWVCLYGSTTQQAMEEYFTSEDMEENPADELSYQDGTSFDEDLSIYSEVYSVPKARTEEQYHYKSWLDELFQDPSPDQDLHWLTDQDVKEGLKLLGGRAQLRQIILEGAMARQKLMKCNVRLVSSIAKRWAQNKSDQVGDPSISNIYKDFWSRPTLDELIQEGVMGLAEATDRFDPDRGLRFGTYATFWITNYVRRKFQRESTAGMRLPAAYYDMKREYISRVREYLRENKEPPPIAKMADAMGVSEKRLSNALRLTQPLVSLEANLFSGQGVGAGKAGAVADNAYGYTVGGMLACEEPIPEELVERSFLRQCLENAMATELSPSERDVVRMRLGLDDGVARSASEVAKVFGGRIKVSGKQNLICRSDKFSRCMLANSEGLPTCFFFLYRHPKYGKASF